MVRNHNTNMHGRPFSKEVIDRIWNKGKIAPEYDSSIWRWDSYKTLIRYSDFGKIHAKYGWEIDHIKPVTKGGTDDPGNLQPLSWKNNRLKGDTYPWSVSR